jgi:DNA-directed RNA polymerase specialized sigma24 family protein
MRVKSGEEAALTELKIPLEGLAGSIGRGSKFKDRLIEDSLSSVWLAATRTSLVFVCDEPAIAWCRRVLFNLLCDYHRKKGRQVPTVPIGPSHDPEGRDRGLLDRVLELDLKASFCDEDLAMIAAWSSNWRVDLLALAGLWLKVPRRLWASWLQEAGLPDDYPPIELAECADRIERSRLLAEAAMCGLNRFHKLWSDQQSRLFELRFVRALVKGR